MALSGSYDFSQHRDSMIKDALVSAGVISDDETPTGEMNASANRLFNRMLKAWAVHGLQLWQHKDSILFLEDGKTSYDLHLTGDRWIIKDDAVETKVNGALVATDTAVTLDTTTGMTAADVIGIETASNTMHWDTIASVDTATTLTLTTGLAAAAADNAYCVAYTTKAPYPNRITDVYLVRYADDDSHQPIEVISREEYYRYNNKTFEGVPNTVYFMPERIQGKLRMWGTPDADNHRLVISAQFPVDDLDLPTSAIGFPPYWMDAIHANLTYRLYLDYGRARGTDRYGVEPRLIEKRADKTLQEAKDFDTEFTELQFEPEVYLWHGQ